MCTVLGCFKQPKTVHTMIFKQPKTVHTMICSHFYSEKETDSKKWSGYIKSQTKPDFASGKYGHWRKSASWEKSKVRALSEVKYFKNQTSKISQV